MTNTHTTHTSPLTHDDSTATALAAELISIADQADANADRYTSHPDDHGGIGSASRAYRTIATSLRWRAQMIQAGADTNLDAIELGSRAAHAWNGPVQNAIREHDQKIAEQEKGKPS